MWFGLKFSQSSSGIHISLHLYPRIFFVHASYSQMKEITHTLPPVCEPTTYLDLFLTKVTGLFTSRFEEFRQSDLSLKIAFLAEQYQAAKPGSPETLWFLSTLCR